MGNARSISGTVKDQADAVRFLNAELIPVLRGVLRGVVAVEVTEDATLTSEHDLVLADASDAALDVTIQMLVARPVFVVKTDATANAVGVLPPDGTTINGSTSGVSLAAQWDWAIVLPTGTAFVALLR